VKDLAYFSIRLVLPLDKQKGNSKMRYGFEEYSEPTRKSVIFIEFQFMTLQKDFVD
jgi:hypothetical protein